MLLISCFGFCYPESENNNSEYQSGVTGLYESYEDYLNDNITELEIKKLKAQVMEGYSLIVEGYDEEKIYCKNIWGFKLKGELFRTFRSEDRDNRLRKVFAFVEMRNWELGAPLRVISDGDYVYYEHAEHYIERWLLKGKSIDSYYKYFDGVVQMNGIMSCKNLATCDYLYISNDLNSNIYGVRTDLLDYEKTESGLNFKIIDELRIQESEQQINPAKLENLFTCIDAMYAGKKTVKISGGHSKPLRKCLRESN